MDDVTVVQKIEKVLEQFRPAVQSDGGNVTFLNFKNGIVYIKLHGACVNCPISVYTIKFGIEQSLKEEIPEVKEVRAIEDE